MRRYALFVAVIVLAGCYAVTPLPPSLVMLTPDLPFVSPRCTGIALDATHVLTANHCALLPRIVTQTGQETRVAIIQHWPADDTAILHTADPLLIPVYALLDAPSAGLAYVWALCPYYFPHTIRLALLTTGDMQITIHDTPRVVDQWGTTANAAVVCGGDSGGVIEQDGSIVGLISAVDSDFYLIPFGVTFYATRASRIAEVIGY